MKRIIITIIPLLLLAACSDDFLDRAPINERVIENFYKTPQDAFEGVVATYDVLQWGDWNHFIHWSEILSDNGHPGAGAEDDANLPELAHYIPNDGRNNLELWKKYSTGIARANLIIGRLNDIDWGSNPGLRNIYESEAKFLRAYFYFDFVRLFGNVPLSTNLLTPKEASEIPQANPADVYAQIVSDLNFAITNLPSTPYQQINPNSYGRITKWAAQGLLARVYLYYTGYYKQGDPEGASLQEVIANLEDLIQNSGHGLVNHFNNLWPHALEEYAGKDNAETVFAIKYTYKGLGDGERTDGNRWQVCIGFRGISAESGYVSGWGFSPVRHSLYDAFDDNDTRKVASIINVETEGIEYNTADQRHYTGLHWRKFNTLVEHDPRELGGNFQIDGYYDYPSIRYADVLLMASELQLEAGNTAKAQEYFNLVRQRAFLDNYAQASVSKENIMEERRLELAFEAHRYWDLLRWGIDKAAEYIDYEDPSGDHTSLKSFTRKFRAETKGIIEIPTTQIVLSNGVLKQNPGWE